MEVMNMDILHAGMGWYVVTAVGMLVALAIVGRVSRFLLRPAVKVCCVVVLFMGINALWPVRTGTVVRWASDAFFVVLKTMQEGVDDAVARASGE